MKAIPILVVAVVQGWLLYGLHLSLQHKAWPATDTSWLLALYAIVVFVPTTLEILADHLRHRLLWIVAGAIALLAACLGGYTGWVTERANGTESLNFSVLFAFYASLAVTWFIAMPFVQTRLRRGKREFPYSDLFEFSWQNALLLAEAGLFTNVFWMLLWLWAALFKVVDISFFMELFSKAIFVYPVTAITFGYAIFLIQTHENIVVTLRRHLLGVFSWLLPLVAMIAVLFLLVLPATGLAPLWKTGHATVLMVWLQILFIHFTNAAYEDGHAEPRYPAWLKATLRVAAFALPVYAALCAYSLGLRVEQHGWTVARIWGAIAIFFVALYGVSYSVAALRRSPWMGGMARINTVMAGVVALVLMLAASPVLDPKRLSANSQVSLLGSGKVAPEKFDYGYLRFDLDRYGKTALAELAKDANADIARLAAAALEKKSRFVPGAVNPGPVLSKEQLAKRIELYPSGAALDPLFLDYLEGALKERRFQHPSCLVQAKQDICLMLALDIDGDGQAEILTLGSYPQAVYGKRDGKWERVGALVGGVLGRPQIQALLRESNFKAEPPRWWDVRVGDKHFALQAGQ